MAVSDDRIFLGTTMGNLHVYERDTEKLRFIYKESGKEFSMNPITCIDVHPWRTEYVVLGFERGQMALININTKKNLK
jgi:hypothetical protein